MKTILVIDNAHATLLLLKEEFDEAGYEVLTTDSGREALEILDDPSKNVNLVITNLRHAEPDGLDFIWLIKRARPNLPVICFTALFKYKELSSRDRPFESFVEKSADLTKLKESVDKLIGEKGRIVGETSP